MFRFALGGISFSINIEFLNEEVRINKEGLSYKNTKTKSEQARLELREPKAAACPTHLLRINLISHTSLRVSSMCLEIIM